MNRECRNCGELIGEARLRARPNAKLCVVCQEQSENAGNFSRHRIEVLPEISGWEYQGQEDRFVRGTDV